MESSSVLAMASGRSAKSCCISLRRFQMAFGVAGEQASGGRERAMVADRGEGVAEFASFGNGIVDAVGGEQRKIERAGEIDRGAVAGFFFAMEMALQFDVDVSCGRRCR